MSDDREEFEAWTKKECNYYLPLVRGVFTDYSDAVTQTVWSAWRAARATPADHISQARNAVIEECCAAIKAEDDRMCEDDYMLDSDDCIRVIRALMQKVNKT